MKTHILEIDNFDSPEEVADFLGEQQLQKGDVLKVITEQDKKNMMIIVVIVVLLALFYLFKKKQEREVEGEKMLDELFKGMSVDEIEQQVEEEYGIKIEVETKRPDEDIEWQDLAVQNFLNSYDDDEPEYTEEDIKEPNTSYGKWKKDK